MNQPQLVAGSPDVPMDWAAAPTLPAKVGQMEQMQSLSSAGCFLVTQRGSLMRFMRSCFLLVAGNTAMLAALQM